MTPVNWTAAPLKRWAATRPSNIDKHFVEGEQVVRLCNYVDVYKNERITSDLELMTASASDAQIEKFTLQANDVIVTKDSETPDDIGVPAHVPFDMPRVVCGYHLTLLRPDAARLHGGYLFWALQSSNAHDYFTTSALGITRFALNTGDIEQFPLAAPSLCEQERIASFLDDKTARIDALIAAKERLATSVAEHADAQISALLTGSHTPPFERRKTDWVFLNEIPKGWKFGHLRWISTRVDVGIAEAATHAYADNGIPILRSTNVRPNSIEGELLKIEPWFAEKNDAKSLFTNDLVTVRTGYPGVTAVIPSELNGCQCFTMLITTLAEGFLPEFYARYLNSAPARGYFDVEAWGSAQKNISVPILKDIMVPMPPYAEQLTIVKETRRVATAAAHLSSHLKAHISRLREYRSSLISAAVTGQLDIGVLASAVSSEAMETA